MFGCSLVSEFLAVGSCFCRVCTTGGGEGFAAAYVVVAGDAPAASAVSTAKARLDRATQAEGLARQQVARDVHQAALMLKAAVSSVAASRRGLEQAEEEFRVVQERFQAGRGIQLEILDAQAAVTRARFNVVSAVADYHGARALWLRATGRAR